MQRAHHDMEQGHPQHASRGGARASWHGAHHGAHARRSIAALAAALRQLPPRARMLVGLLGLLTLVLLLRRAVRWQLGLDQRYEMGFDPRLTCPQRLAVVGLDLDGPGASSHLPVSVFERQTIYGRMDGAIDIKGLSLGGVVTQGLSQADLFHFALGDDDAHRSVEVTPVLKPLDIPVRAMILPLLQASANTHIRAAVDRTLLPVLPPGAIWLQDHRLYHATIYHASSHAMPVPATPNEVAQEAIEIRRVTGRYCPIHGVIERIIITNTGVIVACWQVLPTGSEPSELRAALAHALPRAPPREGQMVKEPSMLHTTVARLLLPPDEVHEAVDPSAVAAAVRSLSSQLCGLTAVFDEVWFVEEQDLLALALEGRYIKHSAPLQCPSAAH